MIYREQTTNKYVKLQKECKEQKEMLNEADKREESHKIDYRSLEKAYNAVHKKFEELKQEVQYFSIL